MIKFTVLKLTRKTYFFLDEINTILPKYANVWRKIMPRGKMRGNIV